MLAERHQSEPLDTLEKIAAVLLVEMQAIPCYENGRLSPIDQAFEELKRPSSDPLSCLRIAKAHILACPSLAGAKEKSESLLGLKQRIKKSQATLMAELLLEALEQNPALFQPHAENLLLYFRAVRVSEMDEKIHDRREQDRILQRVERGQFIPGRSAEQVSAFARLKAGRPLVIDMATLGLGDTCLLPPGLLTVAKTLEMLQCQAPVRLVVHQKMLPLIRHMVAGYGNIEVYSIADKFQNACNLELLLQLASDYEEPAGTSEGETLDGPTKSLPGLILSLRLFIEWIYVLVDNATRTKFLIQEMDYVATKPLCQELALSWSDTFVRAIQRSFSMTLGLKVFDLLTRDDIEDCARGIQACIAEYLANNPSLESYLKHVRSRPGFENGYICLVDRGSDDFKMMTASLFDEIVRSLGGFCRQKRLGLVLIKTSADKNKHLHHLVVRLLEDELPHVVIEIADDVAHTLAFLQHARGVIGPDTFLTHIAEYFPDVAILKIFVSGNRFSFRITAAPVMVEHPLARAASERYDVDVFFDSWLYKREFVHPLAILSSPEENSHFHPIIQETQSSFLRAVQRGLTALKKKINESML